MRASSGSYFEYGEEDAAIVDDNVGAAQFVVTGNTKHFPATWKSTQIVTARPFLDALV